MSVTVHCPHCGAAYRLRDEQRGKWARCKCGQAFQVPEAAPAEDSSLEDLLDEPIGLTTAGTADATERRRPGDPSRAMVDVEASAPCAIPVDLLCSLLRRTIAEHLDRAGSSSNCRLKITVERCVLNPDVAELRLSLAGQIDDRGVHHKTKAVRRKLAAHGGGLLGVVVATAINQVLSGVTGLDSLDERMRQCLQEAIADQCLFIDKQLGRRESNASRRWQVLQWVRWGAAGAVALLVFAVSASRNPGRVHAGQLFLFSLLPAAAIFFCVHALSLATMPASFLLHEPRGQKAMARSGVRSVAAMRAVAILLGIILLIVAGCFSVMAVMIQAGKK